MDLETACDYIVDLKRQLDQALCQIQELKAQINQQQQLSNALERIRQLENERDQWQTKAVSNG
jgi:hypothetical protein